METRIMYSVARMVGAISVLAMLAACAGSVTGKEAGIGFDALNTQSKEDKENEDWFDSFYGKKRCAWGADCPGSGGAWTDSGTGE